MYDSLYSLRQFVTGSAYRVEYSLPEVFTVTTPPSGEGESLPQPVINLVSQFVLELGRVQYLLAG